MPHILNRLSSRRKSLFSVLPAGAARHHNGNIAAALRLDSIFAVPVMMSGLAPLVLSKSEMDVINKNHKNILANLMKLHDKTPDTFVYFISGSLPAAALVHMRQLGLFNMICHLPNNIMNRIAKHALMTEPDTSRSWFIQIRRLCDMYDLPSPLVLLTDPISKDKLKNLVKSKVMDYWEKILRHEASQKPSLLYFKPQFYSLRKPHNIITSTGSNSFELNKSICQIRMLSGRYRDDWLCRHWSPHNKSGECTLCHHPRGDLRHLLVLCQALEDKRKTLFCYWGHYSSHNPYLR